LTANFSWQIQHGFTPSGVAHVHFGPSNSKECEIWFTGSFNQMFRMMSGFAMATDILAWFSGVSQNAKNKKHGKHVKV